MNARAGQPDDHIAGANVGGIEHLGPIDHAHREARHIVIVRAHNAWVLGHLAAHERTARKLAAIGHALYDLGHVLGLDMADGNIVQEEEGFGAARKDVVHAHGNKILAHGLVAIEHLRQHELGAHTVGAADEDGVLHIFEGRSGEQATEPADAADDLRARRLGNHLLDGVDGTAPFGSIYAGIFIRDVPSCLAHTRILSVEERFFLPSYQLDAGARRSREDARKPRGCLLSSFGHFI